MVDLLVYTNHRMGDMYYNTTARMAFFGCKSQSVSRETRLNAPEMSREVNIFWAAL